MVASKKQYRIYLLSWIVTLLATLLFAVVFNYLVDPYGMFDTDRIVGFNDSKPVAGSHARVAKPYQVNHYSPRTVIAGNSRVQMGLDPGHECWPAEHRPVFNLGIPGASVYMAARYLQHAIAGNDVGFVLWGLDFADFMSVRSDTTEKPGWPTSRREFEDRLMINADGNVNLDYGWKSLQDQLNTLISLDTLMDSLNTLSRQRDRYVPTIRRDGFNPAQDYFEIFLWEGQDIIFKQVNSDTLKSISREKRTLYQGESQWSHEFEIVRRLLQHARDHKVKVILFINPYHVDYLVSFDLAGWWPQFGLWKRQLTVLVNEFDVELWDFSRVIPVTTEQPPKLGDKKTILRWFWEPTHYRQEYGDLMLSQMLQTECDPGVIEPVGVLLTPENIDDYLNLSSRNMTRYKQEHNRAIEQLRVNYLSSEQESSN